MSNSKLRQQIAELRRQLAHSNESPIKRCEEKCTWELWASEVCGELEIAKDPDHLRSLVLKYVPKYSDVSKFPENYRVYNANPVPINPVMYVTTNGHHVTRNEAMNAVEVGLLERGAERAMWLLENARLNTGHDRAVNAAAGAIYGTHA